MKLAALADEPSFALLGPGFGGRSWRLFRDLYPLRRTDRDGWPAGLSNDGRLRAPRARQADNPWLIYRPFEAAAKTASVWACRRAEDVIIDHDEFLARLDVRPALARSAARQAYAAAVSTIRRAIAAGDVYQVCLTARAHLCKTSGAQIFALLNGVAAARFAAWVRLPGGTEFVSASPELFFETDGVTVHAEPMKGTARRDQGRVLQQSEKDRAELAMITDLVRNDLTPLCRPRSLRVPCARRMLALPYARQTVSDVVGQLLPGITPIDILSALHPGGSVTGAPKQAALAMIRQLESTPRGPYCGALGIWHEQRARVSLLIRTAYRDGDGWTYGVGSGIVYDSTAEAEWTELLTKLGALGRVDGAGTRACG